jgi:TetR/AcrR family transcriptional repressor of nem operon
VSNIREELIKIATSTIQKSGIHKLTIRDLGNAVNIKSSSVMYHFKNKDGLMYELVKTYNENFFTYLNEINKKYANPKKRLDKLVDLFEDVLNEDKLCLCGMLASESDNLDVLSKEQTKDFFTNLEKWIEDNLNLIKIDKNLAKVIVSSLEGAMLVDKLESTNIRMKAVRQWLKNL